MDVWAFVPVVSYMLSATGTHELEPGSAAVLRNLNLVPARRNSGYKLLNQTILDGDEKMGSEEICFITKGLAQNSDQIRVSAF